MNRREFFVPTTAGAVASAYGASLFNAISPTSAQAQAGQEPLGGQPPMGSTSSVKDFDYQIKYQRAFEAVLWSMPAVAIYRFRGAGISDLGLKDNDIIANSKTASISAFTDLQKGPVVLEVPKAGPDGSLYGQVVDAWQFTIADVGPSGLDKGEAAKYLFTPPGYKGTVPPGYIHIASPTGVIPK